MSDIVVVDSATIFLPLFDNLISFVICPPLLYINLNSVKLGHHYSISILLLQNNIIKKLYFIDINHLKKTTFSNRNYSINSLKTILELTTMPKVIFNICKNSDTLCNQFYFRFLLIALSISNLQNLQLRKAQKIFLLGLLSALNEMALSLLQHKQNDIVCKIVLVSFTTLKMAVSMRYSASV